MAGAMLKFPTTDKLSVEKPFVFYERNKAIALYNQSHPTQVKKISATVKTWFDTKAKARGWLVKVAKEYNVSKEAGYIMWAPSMSSPIAVVQAGMLIIESE